MSIRKICKIIEILSYSRPSYHGTITFHVKLDCGHVAIRDYHKGINPLNKKITCRLCSKIDDFDKYKPKTSQQNPSLDKKEEVKE